MKVYADFLTRRTTTPDHDIGTRFRKESTGVDYIYGQANGAVAAGEHCSFSRDSNKATPLFTSRRSDEMIVKAVGAAFTTLYYGWLQVVVNTKFMYENFLRGGTCHGADNTGLPITTTGAINSLVTGNSNYFEYIMLGAGQTILYPTWTNGSGLMIGLDAADNEGAEWSNGITALSRFAFIIGTDAAFHLKARFTIADVSDIDYCLVGFRKAEAIQADPDNYDEGAWLNVNAGNIFGEAILNGGATDKVDTTDNWADAATHTLEIKVSKTGVVTYLIDGVAPTTVPTSFTFDTGEVVVPILYALNAAASDPTITLLGWEIGLD